MDSDEGLILRLPNLVMKSTFCNNPIWVYIGLQEFNKKRIKLKSISQINLRIYNYENHQLKDLNDTEYDYKTTIIPLKTYYFLDSSVSFNENRSIFLQDTFIFLPNRCATSIDGILISKNKHFSLILMTSIDQTKIRITSIPLYLKLSKIHKDDAIVTLLENHEDGIETLKMDNLEKNVQKTSESVANYFTLISKCIEYLHLLYNNIANEKIYSIEELIDKLHRSKLNENIKDLIIYTREFLIEGCRCKMKEILDDFSDNSYQLIQHIENFKFFLRGFNISEVFSKIISNQKDSTITITFLYDYFKNNNIDNLIGIVNPSFFVYYSDKDNDPILFELINSGYSNYIEKLLKKQRFSKGLSKLLKITVEDKNYENALRLIRNQISNINIVDINESKFIIKKKKNDYYSATPNIECLKIMIKCIIPSKLLLLSDDDCVIHFIGKTLVGGEIVLKKYLFSRIKKNIIALSELDTKSSLKHKTIEKKIIVSGDTVILKDIKKNIVSLPNTQKDKIEGKINLKESEETYENKDIELKVIEECKKEETELGKSEESKERKENKIEESEEDKIPILFPYKKIPYIELSKLSKKDFDEVVLIHKNERIKISKEKLLKDKLKISYSIFFAVLTHELCHAMRIKYAAKQCYSIRTPEEIHNEEGLFIERGIYGNSIISVSINSQKFTLGIAEKIFNTEELTIEEAQIAYPKVSDRVLSGGVCEYKEFDEEDEDHIEYMCTGRISEKIPVIVT